MHGLCSLRHAGSLVEACRLKQVAACRLSCPTACEILVPQPGIEPMSPALEGGFLITGLPGKSLNQALIRHSMRDLVVVMHLWFGFGLC